MRSNTKFSNGGDVTNLQVWYLNNYITIWTFFRVKLVFECDLRYLGRLGPWDLWTLEPLDTGTLGPPRPATPPHTSPYIFLPPPFSSSYFSPFLWFWYGGVELWHWRMRSDGLLTFILILKSCVVGMWNPGTSSFLFFPGTPPSSQTSS